QDFRELHRREPVAIPADLGALAIDDLEELVEVGLRVRAHFFLGQARARLVSPARVADERRVGADDEHDLVSQLLELTEFSKSDRVTQVDVGRRGVETLFHAERDLRPKRTLELLDQFRLGDEFLDARSNDRELPLDLLRVRTWRDGIHESRTLSTLSRARKAAAGKTSLTVPTANPSVAASNAAVSPGKDAS